MRHQITVVRGAPDRPTAVFVHGLGMDQRIWECPNESRVLGGKFPVNIFMCSAPEHAVREEHEGREPSRTLSLGQPPSNLSTLFHVLGEQGYTILSWSQQRPSAEIETAVSELKGILARYEARSKSGIILIGHSRGGLIARKYLACGDRRIRGIVTLATPHRGSKMAQWAEFIAPLTSLVSPLLPDSEKGTVLHAVRKVFDFLRSKAVKELLPGSRFFRSLEDAVPKGVRCLSVGGDNPTLFSVYRSVIERGERDGKTVRIVKPSQLFSVPDILEKVIPARFFPDELTHGKGDGFVSTKSARFPGADAHYDFNVNHAAVLFDEQVNHVLVDALDTL